MNYKPKMEKESVSWKNLYGGLNYGCLQTLEKRCGIDDSTALFGTPSTAVICRLEKMPSI